MYRLVLLMVTSTDWFSFMLSYTDVWYFKALFGLTRPLTSIPCFDRKNIKTKNFSVAKCKMKQQQQQKRTHNFTLVVLERLNDTPGFPAHLPHIIALMVLIDCQQFVHHMWKWPIESSWSSDQNTNNIQQWSGKIVSSYLRSQLSVFCTEKERKQ